MKINLPHWRAMLKAILIRLLKGLLICQLAAIIITALLCYWRHYTNLTDIRDAARLAGLIIIGIGGLTVKGSRKQTGGEEWMGVTALSKSARESYMHQQYFSALNFSVLLILGGILWLAVVALLNLLLN
ncbi:hypothetical protein [Leeia sp.]|uniref:hypothetical protein n=1 Tax=Leeia sp. TaxID=2884678 RepID=UPI0035B18019